MQTTPDTIFKVSTSTSVYTRFRWSRPGTLRFVLTEAPRRSGRSLAAVRSLLSGRPGGVGTRPRRTYLCLSLYIYMEHVVS